MSKITNNLLVKGARGKLGNQFVYKQRGDDTIIARMPSKNKDVVPTEGQELARDRFTMAANYAKGAIENPELKFEYDRKAPSGKTGYNLAFRDFLKAPVVKKIEAGKYSGTPGSLIVISAKDDFRVIDVTVSIYSPTGELLESGNAVMHQINRNNWIYTAVQQNSSLIGSTIVASARDIPGNEGRLEMIM